MDGILSPGSNSEALVPFNLRGSAGGLLQDGGVGEVLGDAGLPLGGAGPVVWTLVPSESTATVTGMSTTSNS
jgi:hypothetical protein